MGNTHFTFATPDGSVKTQSALTGHVNVYNLLLSFAPALARGMNIEEIALAARTLQPVPTRFKIVPGSIQAGFTVVVDYARAMTHQVT